MLAGSTLISFLRLQIKYLNIIVRLAKNTNNHILSKLFIIHFKFGNVSVDRFIEDDVPVLMQTRHEGLPDQWRKYLKSLDDAEEMLGISQVCLVLCLFD